MKHISIILSLLLIGCKPVEKTSVHLVEPKTDQIGMPSITQTIPEQSVQMTPAPVSPSTAISSPKEIVKTKTDICCSAQERPAPETAPVPSEVAVSSNGAFAMIGVLLLCAGLLIAFRKQIFKT